MKGHKEQLPNVHAGPSFSFKSAARSRCFQCKRLYFSNAKDKENREEPLGQAMF